MPIINIKKYLVASAFLLLIGSAAQAGTLWVNCGGKGGFTTIGAAIKALQSIPVAGTATIIVSGACHENVVIQSIDQLTLTAVKGASITDASGGTTDVVAVGPTATVNVEGFTLNGSVGCYSGSNCTFSSNVFQGSPGDGVTISRSNAKLTEDVIQNSSGRGLVVAAGSVAAAFDVKIQHCGSGGATAIDGGNLTVNAVNSSSFVNNANDGIQGLAHSTLRINDGVVIQGNTGHGIRVESASEASLGSLAISNNSGDGVSIGDLSFVWFRGSATVTGNLSGTDVDCRPQFSATRGAVGNIGGGITNCVEP